MQHLRTRLEVMPGPLKATVTLPDALPAAEPRQRLIGQRCAARH